MPIIEVVRSSVPFTSMLQAESACAATLKTLDELGRENHFLLLDSRKAVKISDPVYEKWFARVRRDLVAGFPRTAVVFETIVGKMQGRRLLAKDSAESKSRLFTSQVEALLHLRSVYRASLRVRARDD